MAEYGAQQGRSHARPANFAPVSSHQREAAFASIFNAAPPPGRAQTMSFQSSQSPNERAQSMTAQSTGPPSRIPPVRQQQQSYFPPPSNGPSPHQQSNGIPPPTLQLQQPPQHLPQPIYPQPRLFHPQRVDTRNIAPLQQNNRPMPSSGYPPGPTTALNSNSYRTQSLATNLRPTYQQSPTGSYNMAPASAFRQQSYSNTLSRTTAQGRVVPERPDERTMSMTSVARDLDYSQTMSGRVIPNRRRESASVQELDAKSPNEAHPAPQVSIPKSKQRTPSTDSSSRAMSMASTIAPSERTVSLTNRSSMTRSESQSTLVATRRKAPLVYPALLSKVADAFKERIGLADKEKNGLVYKSAFTGSEAVDLIAYIMQTTDRNLALLLGRSLDAQKFFHDVTYDHRLRDSPTEVYQLKETLLEEGADVNGVFTLTTECYSPTCTPDKLCYSIACPKRVDQQKRLNMKPQKGLKREESRTSLHEERTDEQKLWINTVSKEVADSVNEKEKKRQEVISELMYTERDFVKDLEYLRDFWMKPLRSVNPARPSPIPEHRREKFIKTVFLNCQEIYAVNSKMAEALTRRQQQEPVVQNVGDIFLEYIPRFGHFIRYGANQMFGKYEYEREKQSNPAFAKFVDEVERMKESRKLEINGYLTKPTTRLARYPLLLEGILKYTNDDNPDKEDIPNAIAGIRKVLSLVNAESGKSENHFNLMLLSQQLVWRNGEFVDLKLTEESRQILFRAPLKKSPTDTTGDINGYLFDNALLFAKPKTVNKREELKVYKKPIPLGLLVMSAADDQNLKLGLTKRPSSSLIPGTRSNPTNYPRQEAAKQLGYPITFKHLGKGGFEQTLFCASQIQREKWFGHVESQQRALRERSNIFSKTVLNEGFFVAGMRVNCCVPIDGGRKLVIGTDVGVYITESKPKDASARPKRVLDVKSVTQIDVLEQHSILLVLSDKTLYSYTTEALDPDENTLAPAKRGRKISHANFFKVGVFDGQHLVCCVRTTSLSATIKVFKPMDSMTNSKKKSGLAKMLAGGQEVLKPHKEFYIPTETYSVHFLRSSLCVGCARGFEIVNLETLYTQALLDQADTSLDFVAMKENNIRPIHVERIGRDFLLCYSDFSFFVNRHGWRAFPEWKITWEGNPQSFAVFQPYILAFEPSFIEMRHMDTGLLVYILTAKNVRMLHSSTREILYAYEDEMGEDVIASLDFWSKAPEPAATNPSSSSFR